MTELVSQLREVVEIADDSSFMNSVSKIVKQAFPHYAQRPETGKETVEQYPLLPAPIDFGEGNGRGYGRG